MESQTFTPPSRSESADGRWLRLRAGAARDQKMLFRHSMAQICMELSADVVGGCGDAPPVRGGKDGGVG